MIEKQRKHKNFHQQVRDVGGMPMSDGGLAKIKKQLRDTKRQLQRPSLQADIRLSLERRLKALVVHLEAKSIAEMERKHMLRYKRVRFFERRKAERQMKQAQRALSDLVEADEDQRAVCESQLQSAQLKFLYTTLFPKTTKYISLFVECDENADVVKSHQDHNVERQKEIMEVISTAVKEKSTTKITYDQIRTYFLRDLDWLREDMWKQVVRVNSKLYQMLEMDPNSVLQGKLSNKEQFVAVDAPLDEPLLNGKEDAPSTEQDDFFC